MSFYDMLLTGHKIRIDDPRRQYDSAEFWIENGALVSWAPAFGQMTRNDITPDGLNIHVAKMIADKLKITIFPV